MTTQIPVKAIKSGSTVTALAEFAAGDTIDPAALPAQTNADWNATTGAAEILNKPALGTAAAEDATAFATASQGALADTAVQPSDLATVATTGAYSDLSGRPTLGTAAATDASDYATAAQGVKADTAVQPAALTVIPATSVTGNYTLSNADAGKEVQVNSAVAVTITVPSSGITFGSVVLVRQVGAGQVTISGSTVKSFAATTKLGGQNALASVRFDSSTAVYVSGELAAS